MLMWQLDFPSIFNLHCNIKLRISYIFAAKDSAVLTDCCTGVLSVLVAFQTMGEMAASINEHLFCLCDIFHILGGYFLEILLLSVNLYR